MFVNYFKNPVRSSALNLDAARVLVGAGIFAYLLSYDPEPLTIYSDAIGGMRPHSRMIVWQEMLSSFPYIKWIGVVAAACFTLGYRMGITGMVSATALLMTLVVGEIGTREDAGLALVYAAIIIAMYRHMSRIGLDAARTTRQQSLEARSQALKSPLRSHRLSPLTWCLLLLGLVFALDAYSKLAKTGLSWVTDTANFRIFIHQNVLRKEGTFIGERLIEAPDWLIWLSSGSALVLEAGLIIAIVLGLPLWCFILGLIGMQVMIAWSMGIYYIFYFLPIYMMFLPWDSFLGRFTDRSQYTIVYDENSDLTTRRLAIFKAFDVNHDLTLYSQSDVPDEYRPPGEDVQNRLYCWRDDTLYEGIDASIEILRYWRPLRPLVDLFTRSPMKGFARRILSASSR